ncbi:host-nuclease inhibitor Gam family protein [Ralstonia sp.]|uniref:host-nuclease inhibitor Gam family protein n=1 Tax=Ralstonia sp. TaxID=54061 RepID=UPI00397BA710
MDMATIEKEAQRYAEARADLADLVSEMRTEQEAVKKRYITAIRKAVAKAQQRRDELYIDVEVSPELFKRPKSRVLHGIRVGWRKAKGKLSFPDSQKLVDRIKKMLPERAGDLVKVEEKPIRAELNKLDAGTLKKLGVEVQADQEQPIVEPTDNEIDRIVDALISTEDGEA